MGVPPGTAFEFFSFCAVERSCAHVVGTFAPAFASMSLFTYIASGDQSFGIPYCFPLYTKPRYSRGKNFFVLKWDFLMYGFSDASTPCGTHTGKTCPLT